MKDEESVAPEKKPTRTFSWNGGVGGPMFFSGGSAPSVKINKTVENSTAGTKSEALNEAQRDG